MQKQISGPLPGLPLHFPCLSLLFSPHPFLVKKVEKLEPERARPKPQLGLIQDVESSASGSPSPVWLGCWEN